MPKRKQYIKTAEQKDDMQLPLNELEDGSDISDSEESEYSGLEAEESTSEEEHGNSFLESDEEVQNFTKNGENDSNDSDADENQSGSSDDGDDSNIVNETNEVDSDDGGDVELSGDDTDDDEQEIFVKRVSTAKGKAKIQKYIPKFEDVDTSDEEDIRNTIGNIPMEWYDDYKHFGYDIHGKKLVKSKQGDQLDQFLSKMEDPDYWRTVHDKTNMKEIKLTDDEIDMIQRIQNGRYTDSNYDPYEPYVDWFTGDTRVTPIKDNPASKNSFIPSKWEHKKVIKIVRAIRNGWIKPKTDTDGKPKYYLLWGKDDTPNTHPMHWPAPKLKLPGHEESYNPPSEYLPSQEEIETWQNMDPEDRPTNFLSKKYDSLRKVPGYSNFIQEKFERCLDLYLCPRQRKVRLQINPEDLIPKLPRPKDLQPFPTTEYIQYLGHEDAVRCISVDPTGQWLASGSSDKTIRFWEIATGRCMKAIDMNGSVHSVQWNPQETLPMLAAAVENTLVVINPGLGDKLLYKNIDNVFTNTENVKKDTNELVKWLECSKKEKEDGIRIKVGHKKAIKQVTWHIKGDYIATAMPEGENKSVVIHQLTKRTSQCPFKKSKGQIQCVKFHPHRPFFFVATQRYVRVYNLQKQELTKKLMTGVKWISSLDVHPKGDNLIIGSYDKRLCWFDMDLSSKPYKTLRHHKRALRQVIYHKNYPLFASSSDDGTVIVCHGTVYNDLMQNPLIVPLKILRGHKIVNDLGVIDCTFHPHQPWIFTAGVDKTIRLFT